MPAQFLPANLTYAAFLPENPVIDPTGFKDVPKEPLKAASFVAALPSPSFDPARLEALRPLVRLNNLRTRPDVTEPAADPQPTRTIAPPPATAPAPPPPADDTAGVAFYQGIFIVNAPSTANASNRFAHSPRSRTPTQPLQTASSKPEPRPISIPMPNPSRGQRRPPPPKDIEEKNLMMRVESNLFTQDFEKSLAELDEWSKRYPQSKLSVVRLYDYMQAHSALGHPDRVLEYGAGVMAHNPTAGADGFLDEQQTAGVLYLTMVNAAAIAKPSPQQRTLGVAAAQSLLDSLEHYFQADRRPEGASFEQWANSRRQLESAARAALKKLAPKPAA